jgi:hypothetical protein
VALFPIAFGFVGLGGGLILLARRAR